MHDALIKYINHYAATALTENEIQTIEEVFVPKKIRKRQYFLQEGEVCKYTGFIIKAPCGKRRICSSLQEPTI
jgi:hypothetical protein